MKDRRMEVIFRFRVVCFIIGIMLGGIGSIQAGGLRIMSSAFVPDREFPQLIQYVWDGWDLKYGTREPQEYSTLVPPGATLHVFVQNDSSQPVEIRHIFLNDIDLSKHILPIHRKHKGIRAASYLLNDASITPEQVRNQLDKLGAPIWYQVRPNPIPPAGFAEITVRLRNLPLEQQIVLGIGEKEQKTLSTSFYIDKPAVLSIASVNFNDEIDRMFLYIRRTDGQEFELRSVQVDNKIVNLPLDKKNRKSFKGFLPLEIPLSPAWEYGSFHYIGVSTTDNLTASAVVRARDSFFALGIWGYRNYGNTLEEHVRDTCSTFQKYLFNTHMGMAGPHTGYLRSDEGLKLLQEMGLRLMARDPIKSTVRHPQLYARFLLDEPDAHEYAIKDLPANLRVGSYAQGLVERQKDWTKTDPRTLTLLNVDLTYKIPNWLIYGQLPDILAVDPYYQMRLKDVYWRHPGWLAQFCHPYYVYAISEIARWACEPRPLHVILNSVSFRENGQKFRYATPEEKRIEFYYALAAGAKGISYWWFTPYGKCYGCGSEEPEAKSLMQEMARLNAEARTVLPLLATSCPGAISGTKLDPFASSSPPWLMVRTLFAGTDTAILILINREHASDRIGTIFQPIPKAQVTFQKPPWLSPTTAIRFAKDGKIEPIKFLEESDSLMVELQNIELTEMLIFTEKPTLLQEIQKHWQGLLPQLQAVLKRNP